MILYHFTSRHHIKSILSSGLRLGVIPRGEFAAPKFIYGYQWLTTNPDFNQSWAEGSSLPYDRCEYRLTFKISKKSEKKISKWLDVCENLTNLADILNGYGDPENWRIYKGVLKARWIKEIKRKPAEARMEAAGG